MKRLNSSKRAELERENREFKKNHPYYHMASSLGLNTEDFLNPTPEQIEMIEEKWGAENYFDARES